MQQRNTQINRKEQTEMETATSPKAQDALKKIIALRDLPETSGTVAAERRILNQLNSIETLEVAMALQKYYEEN